METVFEVENVITKKQIRQYYWALMRVYIIICVAGVAGSVLSLTVNLIVGSRPNLGSAHLLLIPIVAPLIPHLCAVRDHRRLLSHYDGAIPRQKIEFGDRIAVHSNDSVAYIEYHQIKKVYSLRDGYALMDRRPAFIVFPKSGFTKGDLAEFKRFLRAKRPDLKIPK